MKRRILYAYFPRLASERILRQRPCEGPFALSFRAGNADHLHCLNAAGEAAGLARGMALADARALCPGLITQPADLVREADFLALICRWGARYSPMVAGDGADGLVADITGVGHLFGGEAALCADMARALARAGVSGHIAVADTRGAACGLARHGGGIAAPGQALAAIGHLPVGALRVDHQTVQALGRLGLAQIADLVRLPRDTLARRFGAGLLLRLDQALGHQPEPVGAPPPAPHFAVRLTLPEPIGLEADVMAALARLLDRLCERLAGAQAGARRLRLELQRVDGSPVLAEIGLARPMRDPDRLAALFRTAIAEIDAGFGIDRLRLSAPVSESLRARQIGTGGEVAGERLVDLVTRLGNRLGFEAIERLAPAQSHIPEKSFLRLAAAYGDAEPDWPSHADRPLLIFPPEPLSEAALAPSGRSEPPLRFRWRGLRLSAVRVRGPERISPEWWLDDPGWRSGLRDYWKVETSEGWRLWLFHTPQAPGWYVHGTFA